MAKDDTSTEVATRPDGAVQQVFRRPDDETLRTIQSPQDALAYLRSQYGDQAVVRASEAMGNGFAIATEENKKQLDGVPMLLISWDFHPGEYYDADGKLRDFVSVCLITEDGRKYIVNDGSTGLCRQLSDFTNRTGRQFGMEVAHGFQVSTYKIGADKSDAETYQRPVPRNFEGPTEPAMTLYLDTSN